MTSFSNQVAKLCYQHFESLPKKGKPQLNKEWTLIAAIVMSSTSIENNSNLKIVTMCTGTKCLGKSQLSMQGDVLSDSHAEVLARRAFLRFLYHHINLVLQQNSSDVLCFNETTKKFSLRPDIKFHFFISHVPCGDAAIFPKIVSNVDTDIDEDFEPKSKRLKTMDNEEYNSGSIINNELIGDIYRTGAKCVKEGLQDPKEPGKNYHIVGVLRTKPGRGEPTLSMSCSDKIALWNVCGLQGALLSHFLESPIYLTSFIFGKCPFNKKAIERAFYERLSSIDNLPPTYFLMKPTIEHTSMSFEYSRENIMKNDAKAVPCPSSIIWSDVPDPLEVSVNGKKQGITKKNFNKPSSRVSICRQVLFEYFLNTSVRMLQYDEKFKSFFDNDVTYLDCKQSAKDYQTAKQVLFKIFESWVHKPESLQKFCIPVKSNKNV